MVKNAPNGGNTHAPLEANVVRVKGDQSLPLRACNLQMNFAPAHREEYREQSTSKMSSDGYACCQRKDESTAIFAAVEDIRQQARSRPRNQAFEVKRLERQQCPMPRQDAKDRTGDSAKLCKQNGQKKHRQQTERRSWSGRSNATTQDEMRIVPSGSAMKLFPAPRCLATEKTHREAPNIQKLRSSESPRRDCSEIQAIPSRLLTKAKDTRRDTSAAAEHQENWGECNPDAELAPARRKNKLRHPGSGRRMSRASNSLRSRRI